jgi:peroxiredoxin
MLRALAFVLLLATPPARAGAEPLTEDPEPRALLDAAIEAAEGLRSGTYKCQVSVTRTSGPAGTLDGEVRFTAIEGQDPIGARLYVRGEAPESGSAAAFKVVYDGTSVQGQLGVEKVIWSARPDVAGLELLSVGETLLMELLYAPERFAASLAGAELTLGAEVEVGGVACREVIVQHGEAQQQAKVVWALATSDHLPRRRTAELHRRGVFQTEVLEIQGLQKNPHIHPSVYRLPTPTGFETKAYAARRSPGAGLLPPGSPAPDFTLRDPSGAEVRLSELRGRVVVLDFWCTWSPLCRETLPLVQKIHERFADDQRVVVYGLAVEERPESDPAAFLKQAGCTYGLLLNGERAAASFQVGVTPTLYVIGTDGTVLYAASGHDPAVERKVGQLIERHLAQ